MRKKIYLSPPALVCCAGQNRNELYESCLSGYQGGLSVREMYNLGKFPVGLLSDEGSGNAGFSGYPDAYAGGTKIIRIINAALTQLINTVEKAVLKYGADRVGLCYGSCDNGSENSLFAQKAMVEKNALPDDYRLRFQSPAFPLEVISRKFGVSGPAFTVSTACASGASAIIRGAELIRAGYCDAVISGGADIVSQAVFSGFHALEAVSDTLTNPFSKNRKGISFGEGAAFFLLKAEPETNETCVELLGYGESSDAYHMTAPEISGEGAAKAMSAALSDAGISASEVDYINLHGTGTELNDKAEAAAMQKVFGSPQMPPASSTKPITGHTMGAAGALEAAICWMALSEKRGLPVHCWDGACDKEVSFSPVSKAAAASAPSICMSNNFAFGGCNVSLILGDSNAS